MNQSWRVMALEHKKQNVMDNYKNYRQVHQLTLGEHQERWYV